MFSLYRRANAIAVGAWLLKDAGIQGQASVKPRRHSCCATRLIIWTEYHPRQSTEPHNVKVRCIIAPTVVQLGSGVAVSDFAGDGKDCGMRLERWLVRLRYHFKRLEATSSLHFLQILRTEPGSTTGITKSHHIATDSFVTWVPSQSAAAGWNCHIDLWWPLSFLGRSTRSPGDSSVTWLGPGLS